MLDDNDVDVAIYPVHVQDPPVLSMSSTPGFGEIQSLSLAQYTEARLSSMRLKCACCWNASGQAYA